jgi:hypothetical protein
MIERVLQGEVRRTPDCVMRENEEGEEVIEKTCL